jgi:hypothetical protein
MQSSRISGIYTGCSFLLPLYDFEVRSVEIIGIENNMSKSTTLCALTIKEQSRDDQFSDTYSQLYTSAEARTP